MSSALEIRSWDELESFSENGSAVTAGSLVASQDFCGLIVRERLYLANDRSGAHAHGNSIFCIVRQGECSEHLGRLRRHYKVYDSAFGPSHNEHALHFDALKT